MLLLRPRCSDVWWIYRYQITFPAADTNGKWRVLDFHRSHSLYSLVGVSCTCGMAQLAGPSAHHRLVLTGKRHRPIPKESTCLADSKTEACPPLQEGGFFSACICRLLLVLWSFLSRFIVLWWHRTFCILCWVRQCKTGRDSAVRLHASELWLFDFSNLATGSPPQSLASLWLISAMEFMASYLFFFSFFPKEIGSTKPRSCKLGNSKGPELGSSSSGKCSELPSGSPLFR